MPFSQFRSFGQYIAVVSIHSGKLVYSGDREAMAAKAMKPGTVFAIHIQQGTAERLARQSAAKYREANYKHLKENANDDTDDDDDFGSYADGTIPIS